MRYYLCISGILDTPPYFTFILCRDICIYVDPIVNYNALIFNGFIIVDLSYNKRTKISFIVHIPD